MMKVILAAIAALTLGGCVTTVSYPTSGYGRPVYAGYHRPVVYTNPYRYNRPVYYNPRPVYYHNRYNNRRYW